jgi:hypothetical protein
LTDLQKSIQKLILKRERKDILRKPPNLQETTNRYVQQLLSANPLRSIGQSSEQGAEENRASHIHILAAKWINGQRLV